MHTHCLTNRELPDALLKFCTISGIHANRPAARPAGEIFPTCDGTPIEIRLESVHQQNFSQVYTNHTCTHTHAPRALSRAPSLPANWPSATPQGQETRLLAEATNLQQMGWPAPRDGSSVPPAWRRRTKATEKRPSTSPPVPLLDTQGPNRKARCVANHPCFAETKMQY